MHSRNKLFQFFLLIRKIAFCTFIASFCLLITSSCSNKKKNLEPIKIGILVSLTGPMAIQDKPIMEAILLAVDEINAKGGLLQHQLKPTIFDSASNPDTYTKGAQELIEKKNVVAIFTGGNSISRRNIRSVVEKHQNVLIFPMHYEGGTPSKNIIYVGAAPNQQIIPGISWAFEYIGHRFFLIGTDSIYSRVANAITKDYIYALNGEVVGESYIPIDSTLGLDSIIDRIIALHPDVIINSIEGPSNIEFFKRLRGTDAHLTNIPTISFGLTENLLRYLSGINLEADYAIWSYFQRIDNQKNKDFEEAFYIKYGKGRAIDDPMESAYVGVYLWAQAVIDAKSFNPNAVLKNIPNQSYVSPSGIIYMDRDTQSAYRPVRIGSVQSNNQFKIIWDSETSIMPVQYTLFRTPQEWDELIIDLYEKWGRQWFRGKE